MAKTKKSKRFVVLEGKNWDISKVKIKRDGDWTELTYKWPTGLKSHFSLYESGYAHFENVNGNMIKLLPGEFWDIVRFARVIERAYPGTFEKLRIFEVV